jgi:multisubunit Na+/H+ antiporter MnhF subunit
MNVPAIITTVLAVALAIVAIITGSLVLSAVAFVIALLGFIV